MKLKACISLFLSFVISLSLHAQWKGLEDSNWLHGKKLKLSDLRRKVVMVEEWSSSQDASETMAFVEKCWRGYSFHPFVLIAAHMGEKDGEKIKDVISKVGMTCSVYQEVENTKAPKSSTLPFMYVFDATGKLVYSGHDKNEAITAVVNALTEIPIPGELVAGVSFKKFRSLKSKIKMGKSVEGFLLKPVQQALKSPKPHEAAEAKEILDSIERAKKNLEEEIASELEDGGNKSIALRDIRWMITTWPSEKEKYIEDFKRLSLDPEAVKGEKEWFLQQKLKNKRKR
jgi:hypothetical protein